MFCDQRRTIVIFTLMDRVLNESIIQESASDELFRSVKDLMKTFRNIPAPLQKLFNTQFFSWLGWLPFYFYTYSLE